MTSRREQKRAEAARLHEEHLRQVHNDELRRELKSRLMMDMIEADRLLEKCQTMLHEVEMAKLRKEALELAAINQARRAAGMSPLVSDSTWRATKARALAILKKPGPIVRKTTTTKR